VYVVDERAGTLTRLDGAGGRPLEPPVPVASAPTQVVVGQDGAALVLAGSASGAPEPTGTARLTYVARVGAGWVA
jgi:streptogramin lyase